MKKQMAAFAFLAGLMLLPGCVANMIPDAPAKPVGPETVRPQEEAQFKAVTTDPDGQSVSFRFAWQLGDTSGWGPWVQSGETSATMHQFTAPGVFQVTCQARDIKEEVSGWSEPLEVLVGNPPRRPTLPDGPAGGWIDSSYSYRSVSTDLDLDRILYVFDWGDGSADTTGFTESGRYVDLAHTWTAADSYDVSVRAIDAAGLESAWSETLRVGIRDPEGPGVLLWSYELGPGAGVSGAPAMDLQGRLLFGTEDGVLHCIDEGGDQAWTYQTGGPIRSSPAIAGDGSVLFGSDDSMVYCLASDGVLRWDYRTGGEVAASPAIAGDGTVYVGSSDGVMYSFDATGVLRWTFTTRGSISSSAAIAADGRVCFGSADSSVYVLNPDSSPAWEYPTGGEVDASPAIGSDGTFYCGSSDGWLYALKSDGTLSWREELGASAFSATVGSDGIVYVAADDGTLSAFYADGGPVWNLDLPLPYASAPLLGSGELVLVGSGNRVYAVSTFGQGSLEWEYRLAGMAGRSLTIGTDGTVYLGDSAGWFYAIRGEGALDSGPWPKFRHDARNTGSVLGW